MSINYPKNKLFKTLIILSIYFIASLDSAYAKENSLMLMITDKTCLYCIIWEKQIGKIYPKTEVSKRFPLSRIEVKDFVSYKKYNLKKTDITPTFIFIKNTREEGRIEGYTNPEMFWWQVDEIIDN